MMSMNPHSFDKLEPALAAALASSLHSSARPVPNAVRDLGAFQGVRSNQLTGYGVVVGLPGTGDDNLEYLTQAMRGVSGRMGNCSCRPAFRPGSRTPPP